MVVNLTNMKNFYSDYKVNSELLETVKFSLEIIDTLAILGINCNASNRCAWIVVHPANVWIVDSESWSTILIVRHLSLVVHELRIISSNWCSHGWISTIRRLGNSCIRKITSAAMSTWRWKLVKIKCLWIIRRWHQVVNNWYSFLTGQRILHSFSITVISQCCLSLSWWLVIDVSLLSNLNQSLDFLAFLRDSDVDVSSNLWENYEFWYIFMLLTTLLIADSSDSAASKNSLPRSFPSWFLT